MYVYPDVQGHGGNMGICRAYIGIRRGRVNYTITYIYIYVERDLKGDIDGQSNGRRFKTQWKRSL